MSKKKRNYKNIAYYKFIYEQLYLIASNTIKWDNLPNEIDIRFIERMLIERGSLVFFEDDVIGACMLPVNFNGTMDIYGVPVKYTANGMNGYIRSDLDKTNSVIICNNFNRTGSMNIIEIYAQKLYELSRTIDVNVENQKTPYFICCTEQQKISLDKVLDDYEDNSKFIIVDKNFQMVDGSVNVIPTIAPYVADKLQVQYNNTLNEFLGVFGIESTNQDKKERLVSDEVGANYGRVENARNIRMQTRLDAVRKINEMFGYDITVEFNSEVQTLVNNTSITASEGRELDYE